MTSQVDRALELFEDGRAPEAGALLGRLEARARRADDSRMLAEVAAAVALVRRHLAGEELAGFQAAPAEPRTVASHHVRKRAALAVLVLYVLVWAVACAAGVSAVGAIAIVVVGTALAAVAWKHPLAGGIFLVVAGLLLGAFLELIGAGVSRGTSAGEGAAFGILLAGSAPLVSGALFVWSAAAQRRPPPPR